MRRSRYAFGAALLGWMMALPVHAAGTAPEARLAKALEGRAAGAPVSCIQLRQIQSSEVFEKTAILYKSGRTWYVNRPVSGAAFLNRSDILITDTHSSQLCNVDIVRLLDNGSRTLSGTLGLGDFVPYTRVAR